MSGIRKADIPDMKAIVELGYEMLSQSVYADLKPDEQKFKLLLAGLMGHKKGLVLVVVDDNDVPQGFLSGIVEEYSFSRATYATDFFTYIRKPYRQYAAMLYNKFISWAKTKPRIAFIEFAQSSGMGDHERWCVLMERLGLVKNGSFYVLEVNKNG